jgi:8-oxo-dGTP diphosphatase
MKKIEVVAAVIEHQGKILAVQRGASKLPYISQKWEFPGGKMEAGETEEQTIIREIREELHMNILPKEKLLTVQHTYPDFHLTMHTWLCTPLNEDLQLNEHQAFVWLEAKDLKTLDWAEADVEVVEVLGNTVVEIYRSRL